METIIVLCLMFALAAAVTAWVERRPGDLLPPPDRSCEREISIAHRMSVYRRKLEDQA